MKNSIRVPKNSIIFGIPLLLIVFLIFFTKTIFFKENTGALSLAITADLLLTIPIVYFLLIRKTSIPKTTIVPLVILGLVVGYFTIPIENQFYLNLFKTWGLPFIELGVVSYIIHNIVKTVRLYKSHKDDGNNDFFTTLKTTCHKLLPNFIVTPFVTEIAVVYYGFFNWKKRKLKPNEFSYHKENGTVALLLALLFVIAIETIVIHLVLIKWNNVVTWILTNLSIYSGIQIIGFLKSILKRPIMIVNNVLYLRYGIMKETQISINQIESIELSSNDIEISDTNQKLSLLGNLEGHNLIIRLKKENTIRGLYGTKKAYKVLVLQVDQKIEFKNQIDQLMNSQIND